MGNRKVYVGQSALQKAGLLRLNYPIQNRISVSNWEDLHETLHHCFYQQLRIVPSEQPCLLSTSSEGLKNQRETMTQFMFERFQVPAFYLGMQDILSLYSLGKTTGLVLDAGHVGA